jgi:diacylglycerol kinase (ATP)
MLLIVNPQAGGGRGRRRVTSAITELRSAGMALEVRETSRAGDASDIAHEALHRGVRSFVAAGGDGTVFETLNGIFRDGTPSTDATLGILPVGTGNSFLRDFGVSSLGDATRRIVRGQTASVDIVRVTHGGGVLHYVNLLSVGFTADAGARTNARWKPLGRAGYVGAVVEAVIALRPFPSAYALDGGATNTAPCTFVAFSNSQFTGGTMHMAPGASVSDGRLDVVHAGPMTRSALLAAFPGIFRGTHVNRADVQVGRAAHVRFEPRGPVPVLIDGEVRSLELRSLEVLPSAIKVFA